MVFSETLFENRIEKLENKKKVLLIRTQNTFDVVRINIIYN